MTRAAAVDLWRRVVPGRPRIDRVELYSTQRDIPEEIDRHTVAVVGASAAEGKWAAFECPCGRGHRIMVPLRRRTTRGWRLTVEGDSLSLDPSVNDHGAMRCHFWLRKGRVHWSPDRTRGRL